MKDMFYFTNYEWMTYRSHVTTPHLVRSAYQVKVVFMEELGDHLCPECETHAPVILAPAHGVLVGVWPQEVAEEPLVRDIGGSHDPPDLLHALQVGTEPPVATEDLLVNDSSNWEAVEAVREGFPQLNVISSFTWGWVKG